MIFQIQDKHFTNINNRPFMKNTYFTQPLDLAIFNYLKSKLRKYLKWLVLDFMLFTPSSSTLHLSTAPFSTPPLPCWLEEDHPAQYSYSPSIYSSSFHCPSLYPTSSLLTRRGPPCPILLLLLHLLFIFPQPLPLPHLFLVD